MTTKLKSPNTTTNLAAQTTAKHKSTRSSTSFGASTTRSINSTSSSISSCSSRRSCDNNNSGSKSSKSCTNTNNSNTCGDRRFNTHAAVNGRTSLFRSFITSGPRVRQAKPQSNDFAYDLSKDESKFMGTFKGPMKTVPDNERELLKSGQRGAYLALRYEHSPDRKYNYPEATSWRIGWFHNQLTRQGVAT
uniref:Sperm microtubule inner protein 1 C-terminal domain-containing protein n=1 Tax=Bactrocera latifrons TaxID=174628 RepID=A0A0K8VA80_BACLA